MKKQGKYHLLCTEDQGTPIQISSDLFKSSSRHGSSRWIDPFLKANRSQLQRLNVKTRISSTANTYIDLIPGNKIGAIPLLSPSTRNVVSGLLIKPRFDWPALGAVYQSIGFNVEPTIGGAPMVPGSAVEVPSWIIAGPVLNRIRKLLSHQKRGFIERREDRISPRGQIDWGSWGRKNIPSGKWTSFNCCFSEPSHDPTIMASIRWTLKRLKESLAPFETEAVGRILLQLVEDMQHSVGKGREIRAPRAWSNTESLFVAEALESMGWVADRRGLGGVSVLDGLAWDVKVEDVWEAWVVSFFKKLAPRLGFRSIKEGSARRLNWQGIQSMGHLIPDAALQNNEQAIWIDAKYKRHLMLLGQKGWNGIGEKTKTAHRADIHQALAYANLNPTESVTSILVYPIHNKYFYANRFASTEFGQGHRKVKLILGGIPFGFSGPEQEEQVRQSWARTIKNLPQY